MRLDRVAGVVVNGPSLQIVFGHAEAALDAPQLVIRIDDELRNTLLRLVVYPFHPARAGWKRTTNGDRMEIDAARLTLKGLCNCGFSAAAH